GTATARITFQADPGVVINTPNTFTNLDGIYLNQAGYITIDGFTITAEPRDGIRAVGGPWLIIRNNTSDNNVLTGILTAFTDDILIENNVFSRSQQDHGIYLGNSGDRPVIRGNSVWGNYGNGIHMNGDISQGGDGIISNGL